MKKIGVLILAADLMLSLAACGGSNIGENGNESGTGTEAPTLEIGETITTDYFEFALTDVDFLEESDGLWDYYNSWSWEKGEEAFILCTYSVRFVGKEEVSVAPVSRMTVSYGDGYTFEDFREFIVYADGEDTVERDGTVLNFTNTYTQSGSNMGTNVISFRPLAEEIYTGYGYLKVPAEVMQEESEPLTISISVSGGESSYSYRLR